MYVHDTKLAGKTENVGPTGKILIKDVDLKEPTSFLDHVNLGCTQRECQISKDIVANYRDMFESRISAGAMQRNAWKDIANLQTTQQLFKVATPCMDDHQFEEEEIGSVGELSTVCSQFF